MPQVSQSIPPYTPTGVEVSISRDKSWPYSAGHWAAARQAIIRSGVHKDQTDKGRALHPMYHSFHECPVDLKLKKELVDSMLEDAFDALATLDRIDGGVSVLFRCPSYPVARDIAPENVSIDTFCTPYLVDVEGMQERLAYMIQGFGDHIAVPHLRRFAVQHASDPRRSGILTYSSAEQLHIQGPAYLPSFESAGSGHLRARCRPKHTLAQDISTMKTPSRTSKTPTPGPFYSSRSHSNSSLSDVMNFELEDLDSHALPRTPKKEIPVMGSNSQHEDPAIVCGLETANLQAAAIISIGEKTNRVLDHFGMADSVIPRLRKLVCTVRSSRWEEVLRSPEWGLTTTQAKSMSKALLADIAQEITKEKTQTKYGLSIKVMFLSLFVSIISIAIFFSYLAYY